MTPRVPLGAFIVPAVKPAIAADRMHSPVDYYSLAAFAAGIPDIVPGDGLDANAQAVEPGDVLVSRIAAQPRRAWVVGEKRSRPQAASSEWLALRASAVDSGYLHHLLVSNDFHLRCMRAVCAAGNIKRIRAPHVAPIEIPLPAMAQQRRIAQALTQADALRAKRRATLASLDRLPNAVFLEWFGDPATNPKGWPHQRLATVLATEPVGGSRSALNDQGAWLVLRARNLGEHGLDLAEPKYATCGPGTAQPCALADGDLLLARAFDARLRHGRCAVVYPGEAHWTMHAELVRVRFDRARAEPEFVCALFASRGGGSLLARSSARSANRAGVDPRTLAAIELPLPPIELQREFADYLAAMEASKVRMQTSRGLLDLLLGTLRDRAFRGELDLV